MEKHTYNKQLASNANAAKLVSIQTETSGQLYCITFAAMSSIRQEKINGLLQQEIALIFQKHRVQYFGGLFISVTVVRTSPDMGTCKVFLSIMGDVDKKQVVKELNGRSGLVRKKLGEAVGKQLRRIPELHFYLDDSLDYAETINKLLK